MNFLVHLSRPRLLKLLFYDVSQVGIIIMLIHFLAVRHLEQLQVPGFPFLQHSQPLLKLFLQKSDLSIVFVFQKLVVLPMISCYFVRQMFIMGILECSTHFFKECLEFLVTLAFWFDA